MRYFFQLAIQCATKFVQRLGFNVVIGAKAADRLSVDTAFFPKPIGGNAFLLHGYPKFVIYNHNSFLPRHLDISYYGVYNPHN